MTLHFVDQEMGPIQRIFSRSLPPSLRSNANATHPAGIKEQKFPPIIMAVIKQFLHNGSQTKTGERPPAFVLVLALASTKKS